MGFTFTRLAKAVADTKYSIDDVTKRASEELTALDHNDADSVAASPGFMHCFGMTGGVDNIEFIILCLDATAFIDTVSYEEQVLDSGPFKGKTVLFPVPDSLSSDD